MMFNLQVIMALLSILTGLSQAQQIQFNPSSYFVEFNEEQPNGTAVAEVRASYLDSFGRPGADGVFSLPLSGDAQYFTVQTVSDGTVSRGIIYSNAVFDRDSPSEQTRFSFTSTYTIPGGTFDSVSVTVVLRDINDNPPLFPSRINEVQILEDSPAQTSIANITATDPDQVLSQEIIIDITPDVQDVITVYTVTNGRILYNITAGNDLGHFSISQVSGTLSISPGVILDIDTVDLYNLTVMATDGGGLTDSTTVIIEVIDANDNAPQILGPLGVNLTITEDTPPGYILVDHINATDLDRGVNAEIRFSIITGDTTNSFMIDDLSGRIEVRAPLDRERGGTIELTVEARDLGIPLSLRDTVQVVINLLDINDYAPQFTQSSYTVSASENLRPPAFVATLEAIDLDQGPNGTVTYIILQGGDDKFTIDNSTGIIRTTMSLDHEEIDSYQLLVEAFDNPLNDSYRLSTEVNVTILVGDLNDNAPIFLQPAYNVSILDNQRRRTEILRVTAADADGGSNGEITYLISAPDPTDSDAFLVDETSGVIYRERRIVFENQNVYHFTVQARDGGAFPLADTTSITIYVHNVNENPPEFSQQEYNATILETTSIGTVVLNVSATDPDIGLIGEVRYRVVSNFDAAGSFDVDPVSGEVFVSSELDFDIKEYISFEVEAYDGGFPEPFTNRTNVTVFLIGENDEAPSIIFPDGFFPTVPENVSPGVEVVFLSQYTFDPDFGSGGEFTFRLNEIFDEYSQNDSFSLNETTGLITSLRTFDRELQPEGILVAIETIDFGTPQVSNVTNITITIGDKNDNPPYFETNTTAEVYEFMPSGTQVPLNYTALDDDIGMNARLEYGIFGGENSHRFRIDPASGAIFTAEILNKTVQKFYNLTIIALDQGSPQMFGFGYVLIEVIDANDQVPLFSESVYNASLAENSNMGTFITQVNATDVDIGTNADFEYFIRENTTGVNLFVINSTSGEIFSNSTFDRENVSMIDIEVIAIDNGLFPLTGSATVRVYIQDINDHSPVFNETLYTSQVTENAPNYTVITTLLALDDDAESPSNKITYSLLGNRSENFIVDSSTGNVLVAGEVDWELGAEFTLTVLATDGGIPPLTDMAELTIHIEDVNDVVPMFVPSSLNLSIFENTLPGNASVGIIQTIDADSPGNNSLVTYTILMDFSSGRFKLDSETGLVTFAQGSLDREDRDLYDLLIRASDHGNPQLHTDATLYITVVDSNEFSPVFDRDVYIGQIEERVNVGTSILTLVATDIDIDLNGELRYSIIDSVVDNLFEINAVTGVISTMSELLDFESVQSYRFQVVVTDLGAPMRLNDTALVIIDILDSNDNVPVFQEQVYSAAIRENLASGTTILQVCATDNDSTTNAEIEYTLPSGVIEYLGVDPLTGVVYTKQSLDREVTPEFNFLITANNSAAAFPLFSTVNVLINVTDLNDMHPTFDSITNVKVPENTTVDEILFTLSPEDGDEGRNGTVSYTLTHGNEDGYFTLDEESGDITLLRNLDFETRQLYILTIMANDSGSPSLSNYTNVLIHVVDVNDHVPQFFASNISVTISFAADVGSIVTNLEACDADSPPNAQLVFHITSGNELGLFELVSSSQGLIRTAGELSTLQIGNNNAITLSIQVSNPGESMYSTGTVRVFIDEGQLATPRFTSQNFTASLSEDSQLGATVFDFSGHFLNVEIFSLTSDFTNVFSIDSVSGIVTLMSALDYESQRLYQLTIEGRRIGENITAYTVLNVQVTDENEHTPEFISSSFFIALSETAPINEPFFVAMATDADGNSPANDITYSLTTTDSTIQSFIGIDPQTGGLFLRRSLDYESNVREFNFTISATNGLVNSNEAAVTIIVLNGNTFSPVFVENRIVLTYNEDIEVGLNIANFTATDQDEGSNGDVTYGIHGNHDYLDFRINTYTGQLFINNQLDYERHTFYTLNVIAGDGGNPSRSSTAIIQITILDLNDNTPAWESVLYSVITSENATVGTVLINVTATDADQVLRNGDGTVQVDNGLVTYTIEEGDPDNDFFISPETGVVSVAMSLNRENTPVYNLTLRATDGGGRFSEAYLHIMLTDVNDEVPSFTESPYIVGVPENSPIQTLVVTVVAMDTDLRKNSELTYHFSGSSSDEFVDNTGTFHLNDTTGDIFLIGPIDREEINEYTLSVEAVDMGITPLTGTVDVRVEIIDINEFAPVFTAAVYNGSVYENKPTNTSVLQVDTIDEDFGENSTILYSVVSGNSIDLFSIIAGTGEIRVARQIDYELVEEINLVVMATDSGPIETRLTSKANVTIFVLDRNDNVPQLDNNYTAFIPEDSSPGDPVLLVTATDSDSGVNAQLIYSLDPLGNTDVESNFQINSSSGMIYLSSSSVLERESVPSYSFLVNVSDSGAPALKTSSPITVYVTDANDNVPQFISPFFEGSLSENLPNITIIVTVQATDEDIDANAAIVYQIIGLVQNQSECFDICGNQPFCKPSVQISNSTDIPFSINTLTGVISSTSPLDREAVASYILLVRASDSPINDIQLSNTTCVYIDVLDQNDEIPVFSQEIYRATISEHILMGDFVIQLFVEDGDILNNSKITFELNTEMGSFTINPKTGIIMTLISSFDRETRDVYNLTISAQDGGFPPLSSSAIVVVTILDENDSPPQFSQLMYFGTVDENAPSGTFIFKAAAFDEDIGLNAQLSYSIVSVSPVDPFIINSTTGILSTSQLLDREGIETYIVTVMARDNGTVPLNTTTTVNVTVLDENDLPPIFINFPYIAEINENTRQPLITVMTTDGDVGTNADVYYTLVGVVPLSNMFELNLTSGEVVVAADLDAEYSLNYTLTINASNGQAMPHQSSVITVDVQVTDLNDNVPHFEQSDYVIPLLEATPIGSNVTLLGAFDNDATIANSLLKFEISGGQNQSLFGINSTTGWVYVAGVLDREKEPEHLLEITVSDNGSPQLNTTTTLRIILQDFNDNPPVFGQTSYSFRINENENISILVGYVRATDMDIQTVSYSLVNTSNFQINSTTGGIYTAAVLDREEQEVHSFIAVATDEGGMVQRSAEVVINITLLDLNDVTPYFPNSPYTVYWLENTTMSTILLTVEALDNDLRDNSALLYTLVDGNDSSFFSVNVSSGDVALEAEFDREDQEKFVIFITANDLGTPSLTGTAAVQIIILDNNDNVPLLNATEYRMSLPEDTKNGTVALVVGATDRDINENANITFSLSEDFEGIFSIGAHNGVLTLTGDLDYELVTSYSFFVIATDNGEVPLANMSSVYIEVIDLNDNPPIFDAEVYKVSIPENSILSTSVFQIPATDADSTTNSELRYTILSGNLGGIFKVDEIFGLISTADYLDREVTPSYMLGIRVVDLGTPQFTATAMVEVTVLDVNDNSPQFAARTYSVSILESVQVETEFFSISASDMDIGGNANLTYSILEGNIDSTFRMDLSSGALTTIQQLDFENVPSYTLVVAVSDNGFPASLIDTAIILISVTDVNEDPPYFSRGTFFVHLAQNLVVGSPIGYFAAVDNDTNSIISYSLRGSDGLFDVYVLQGTVYVSSPLPAGGHYDYELVLMASDQDYVSNITINVTVVPFGIALSLPFFSQPAYRFEISESASRGTIVGSVSDQFVEIISDGETFGCHENGSVFLNELLDYETQPVYIFNVKTTEIHLFAIVTVEVLDENDNSPMFESPMYTLVVSELQEIGSVLLPLRVLDIDSPGVNQLANITLLEIGNEERKFAIDPLTGSIVLVNSLDYEEQIQFNLTAVAANHLASLKLSNTAQVVVMVTDTNDNDPVFAENFYHIEILEFTPVGTEILTLEAQDIDSGTNSELVFAITHLSVPLSFVLNTTTGAVSTNMTFNLTQDISSYEISALVSDRGNPQPRSDTITVFIDVLAVNLYPPQFTQPGGYAVKIPETASIGYRVLESRAIDPDDPTAMIQYQIVSGESSGKFSIDPSSGVIELSSSLDFVEQSLYLLTISATDFGSPPNTSFVVVNISVIDINTHTPQFIEPIYEIEVFENITVGSFVLQVIATDADTVSITYQITVNVQDNGVNLFQINSTSGEIFTAATIDREFADIIEILVSAIDSGYPIQRSQSISVRVIVRDLNDNRPVFSRSQYILPVVRLLGVEQPVGIVIATDDDIIGEELTYSIVGDSSGGLFRIDWISGQISSRAVVPETAELPGYELVVSVTDGLFVTNVTVELQIVDDGEFCNNDGLCTLVREVNCTFDIFPFVECNPFCVGQFDLSPQQRVCLFHYCLNTSLVPCIAMETCLPPNQACAGVCPEGMSVCPTTDICHMTSLNESCDQSNETCLINQTLIQRNDASRYCEITSNLPLIAQNCSSKGQVFCEALNECHRLTEPYLCQACPGDLVLCPDTDECVSEAARCCGTAGYYCDVLSECLENGVRCELPNIAPAVSNPLIYLETMETFPRGNPNEGHLISMLLGNNSVDTQGEEVSVAIVQASSVQDSYGEWQYALCEDSPSDVTGECSTLITSWTVIDASVLSESNALVLPNKARVRFNRRAIELDGGVWLRAKLWDGNTDGFISPRVDLVCSHTPSYETTLPYAPNNAFSENTTLIVIVILPLISQPVFNNRAPLQLSSIQEDVVFADNLGNQISDIVISVDIPDFQILAEDRIQGFEPIQSQNFSEAQLPNNVMEAYYSQVALVNPTRKERQEAVRFGQNPGVAISLTSDSSAETWQVSLTEDPRTFVNLQSILSSPNSGQILLLNTTARIRFLPSAEFCGSAFILARPWDGYWNQSVFPPPENGYWVVISPEVNPAASTLSPTNLNEWTRIEINVMCVEDPPLLTASRVHLSLIPYRMKFRYERIFTIIVDQLDKDVRTEINRLSDFLQISLEVAVDMKKISPVMGNRTSVSFSVIGDILTFSQVCTLIEDRNSSLSQLGFPIRSIEQDVSYGPGAGCQGDEPQPYHGDHVNSFFSQFSYDTDNDFLGVAVVSMNTSTQGVWQYHRGNWNANQSRESEYNPLSNVWINFPPPSQLSERQALLLHGNDRLRFLPHPDAFWDNTSAPTIGVKIWDGSMEGLTPNSEIATYNINTDPTVDTVQSLLYPQGRFSDDILFVVAARMGCDGAVNSGRVHDACCECGGAGDSCEGCDGLMGSSVVRNACDQCGTLLESTCLGCDFIPFSGTEPGHCTECISTISIPTGASIKSFLFLDPLFSDCNGDCYGNAVNDSCSVCSGGNTSHEANSDIDCAGVCFGAAVIDICGDCTGPGTDLQFNANLDCTGVCNGPFFTDSCEVCQLANQNGTIVENRDCAGECYGTAVLDSCGQCVGGLTNLTAGYTLDECGVCEGDGSLCVGCDGQVASGQTVDSCGECGGNNCGCFQLNFITPNRGPRSGGTVVTVQGAGFFLNNTNRLQFQYNRSLDNCGAPQTYPDGVGRSVRIVCLFRSTEQQQQVFAEPVDQSTVRCVTEPTSQNQIYIREFTVQVRIEDGPFSNPVSFFYDDYRNVTINSFIPPDLETRMEGTVSFIGSNFLNTSTQVCLIYNFEQCLTNTSAQSPLSIPATFLSSSEIACQLPPADVPCQVILRLSLDGQESGIIDTSVTFFTYAYNSPVIYSVHFSTDLSRLLVQFDRQVAPTNLNCSTILSSDTLSLVGGQEAACNWADNSQQLLAVSLPCSARVQVNSPISFAGNVLSTRGQRYSYAVNSTPYFVHPTRNTRHPQAVLNGPTSIPACGLFTFSGISSQFPGYGGFEYHWTVRVRDSTLSNYPEIVSLIDSYGFTSPEITLNSELFLSNVDYYLQLQVFNSIGLQSEIESILLMKDSEPRPFVLIQGDVNKILRADEDLAVQSMVTPPDCLTESQSYDYTWRLTRIVDQRQGITSDIDLSPLKTASSSILIPRSYFMHNTNYTLLLEVAINGGSDLISTEVIVSVLSPPLRAQIGGGDRTISQHRDVVLDGQNTSLDSDTNLSWSCQVIGSLDACYNQSQPGLIPAPLSLPKMAFVSFPASQLEANRMYTFTLTLVRDGKQSQASVTIEIVADQPSIVQINPPGPVVSSEPIVLEGLVFTSAPARMVYWESVNIVGQGTVDLDNPSIVQSQITYESTQTNAQSFFTVNVTRRANLILMSNTLTPELNYTFRLTVQTNEETAYSQVTITPLSPPQRTELQVTPTHGLALETEFQLEGVNSIDDPEGSPFLYAFGIVDDNNIRQDVTSVPDHKITWLSADRVSSQLLTILPTSSTSQLILLVRVIDRDGGISDALSEVTVSSNPALSSEADLMSIVSSVNMRLELTKDWNRALSSLVSISVQMNVMHTSLRKAVLDSVVNIFENYLPPSENNYQLVVSLLTHLTANGAILDHTQQNNVSAIVSTILQWYNNELRFEQTPISVPTQNVNEVLYLRSGYTKEAKQLLSDRLAEDLLRPLSNLLALPSPAENSQLLSDFVQSVDLMSTILCKDKRAGESASMLNIGSGQVYADIAQPRGSFDISGINVNFQDSVDSLFEAQACSTPNQPCLETCVSGVKYTSDLLNVGTDILSLDSDAVSMVNSIAGSNPQGIEIFSDIVSASLSIPSQDSFIQVLNLASPIEIFFPVRQRAPIDGIPLCLYRNVGGGDGFDDTEWQLDSLNPPQIVSMAGEEHFVCMFNHLTQFVVGLLPPPVITTPPPITTTPPTELTTEMITPPMPTTPDPTNPPPEPVSSPVGPIVAVIIVLLLIVAGVIVVIVIVVVWKKKRSKKVQINPTTDETDGGEEAKPNKAGPLTPEESKVPMQIILCADKGERKLIGKLNVLPSIRLRELRYQLADNFEMFKNKPFYFLTRQLCDIEPAAEQQQFVSLVFGDKPIFVRDVPSENELTKKHFCVCGNAAQFECSNCGSQGYCSPECQLKHWGEQHQRQCGRLSERRRRSDVLSFHSGPSRTVSPVNGPTRRVTMPTSPSGSYRALSPSSPTSWKGFLNAGKITTPTQVSPQSTSVPATPKPSLSGLARPSPGQQTLPRFPTSLSPLKKVPMPSHTLPPLSSSSGLQGYPQLASRPSYQLQSPTRPNFYGTTPGSPPPSLQLPVRSQPNLFTRADPQQVEIRPQPPARRISITSVGSEDLTFSMNVTHDVRNEPLLESEEEDYETSSDGSNASPRTKIPKIHPSVPIILSDKDANKQPASTPRKPNHSTNTAASPANEQSTDVTSAMMGKSAGNETQLPDTSQDFQTNINKEHTETSEPAL